MRFQDLLTMSISSLWRRKLRTILTILGVVIGTASIVVMISLGLGLNKASMEQIEQFGGLTTINVTGSDGGGGGMWTSEVSAAGSSASSEPVRLDDTAIEALKKLEHVKSVSPRLSIYVAARQGVYENSFNLIGTTPEDLESMNIPLEKGAELPTSPSEMKFLYGNMIITDFYNSKTGQNYWETQQLPDVDLNKPMFIIYDTDAYWSSQGGGTDENGNPIPQPKKYVVESAGVVAGSYDEYKGDYSYSVYCNIDALKMELKKVFKGKVIPGQPTTKSGKPYKELFYSNAAVQVDDLKNVEDVQKAIQNMGYNASSNIEWINQTKQQSRSIQAALGGIGAVSLFVAAIGIANTMMMSIYERTKEIGVIKVLGCDLANIRNMFLAEAGFIGLIGGAIGIILSFIISFIINFFASSAMGYHISYIPFWLVLIALNFGVLVGMISGLFPALRAMRLSPLAAIRNE